MINGLSKTGQSPLSNPTNERYPKIKWAEPKEIFSPAQFVSAIPNLYGPLFADRKPRVIDPIGEALGRITKEEILKHISEISDDSYMGRQSPSEELNRTAKYISDVAGKYGLVGANPANKENPFLQTFELYGFVPMRDFYRKDVGSGRPVPVEMGADWPELFRHAIHKDELIERTKGGKRPNGENYYAWGNVSNVVGILEGQDPVLKNEYVIVSAHYDHIGTRFWGTDRIYNGADDNASGVAVLLGLLPALASLRAAGKGPKRSIIFVFTAAEEKGLVGADYYRKNPLRPLEKTKAAINVDMIGRLSPDQVSICDIDKDDKPSFFRESAARAAPLVGFKKLDHDVDKYMSRQDGGIWVNAGIPTAFLYEGFTPDGRSNPDYHGVDDEVDRIVKDNGGIKPERMARLALLLLLDAASRPGTW